MNIRLLKFVDAVIGRLVAQLLPCPLISKAAIPIKSLLIVRPGGIGDAALLVPVIRALKEKYPEAEITVLAEQRNGSLFSLCTAVNTLLLYDRPKELLAAIRGRYDVVIDTEQWHRLSAVVARFTGALMLIGFGTNERKKLFTQTITYSHECYEADSFFSLLEPLGIACSDGIINPYLVVSEDIKEKMEERMAAFAGKPFVAIFSGASISERRWGANKFALLAEQLYIKGYTAVVVGGQADKADGELIVKYCHGLNLAGKTSLVETAAVIDKAALLVSGDSGILHIGVGLGKPTVSLFGPGIAKKWAPRGEKHIVINKNLPCSPCTKFGYTPKCPINAKCMADITVDEVVAAVEKLLQKQGITGEAQHI